MARRSEDKRWDSKFAQFVQGFGVEKLAKRLRIEPSAVYHWMSGKTSPHPSKAISIQGIAKRRGVSLSLDEIYSHFRAVQSEPYKTAAAFQRSPQHARSL